MCVCRLVGVYTFVCVGMGDKRGRSGLGGIGVICTRGANIAGNIISLSGFPRYGILTHAGVCLPMHGFLFTDP